METIDPDGVGPFAPIACGRRVRSAEPFGLGAPRMVRMDESEGGVGLGECGCARITVVLYSE